MPFTFAHPAIILPLTLLPKKWFSITGLVIGSLTPDFEYFLRMEVRSRYSHTIGGLFWFDLPMGIILAFIFHNIVRNVLFDNLPDFLRSRVNRFQKFDWNFFFKRNWPIAFISILVGAASHLLWDACTHEGGYFVERIPFLKETAMLFNRQVPVLKIAQHLSTLLGGLAIVAVLFKLPKNEEHPVQPKSKYWSVFFTSCFAIVVIRMCFGLSYTQYGAVVVTTISAILISLTLTSWLIQMKKN